VSTRHLVEDIAKNANLTRAKVCLFSQFSSSAFFSVSRCARDASHLYGRRRKTKRVRCHARNTLRDSLFVCVARRAMKTRDAAMCVGINDLDYLLCYLVLVVVTRFVGIFVVVNGSFARLNCDANFT